MPKSLLALNVAGVCAIIWGGLAWAEWFWVLAMFPSDGGPLPHIAFAPQFVLLLLGCVAIVLVLPVWSATTRAWWLTLYALPAATYVAYQVVRLA